MPKLDRPSSRTATTAVTMTASVGEALHDAVRWAAIRHPHHTTSLHLLVGLVHATNSIAAAVLDDNEISDANVWSAIDYWDPPRANGHRAPLMLRLRRPPRWKSSARAVVSRAVAVAADRASTTVDTGDLLEALVTEHNSRAARILERAQLDAETLHQLVKMARGEINEGRAVGPLTDVSSTRPIRPQWQGPPR